MERGWEGTVDIDVILSAEPLGLFVFLSHDDQVIGEFTPGKKPVPESLSKYIRSRLARGSLQDDSTFLIEEALKTSDNSYIREIASESIAKANQNFYIPLALNYVPDDSYQNIAKTMSKDGLLPLLGDSIGLILDCAGASLCVPLKHRLDSLDSFHRWSMGTPLNSIEKANELLQPKLGVRPFVFQADVPLLSMI